MVVTILVMRLKHINTIGLRVRSPGGETILALVSINCNTLTKTKTTEKRKTETITSVAETK